MESVRFHFFAWKCLSVYLVVRETLLFVVYYNKYMF